jgi:hypothetical protein
LVRFHPAQQQHHHQRTAFDPAKGFFSCNFTMKNISCLHFPTDPAIYSALLPRPGSNDNAWESLIEVTKTSETSKLQQLVDNIEHKLTGIFLLFFF